MKETGCVFVRVCERERESVCVYSKEREGERTYVQQQLATTVDLMLFPFFFFRTFTCLFGPSSSLTRVRALDNG